MSQPVPAAVPETGFAAASAAVADVEGWMTPGQARKLWDCASAVRTGGQIVEIGSFRGRSTIVLARAIGPAVRLVAIDPHAGNDRGPQEIEGFEEHAAADFDVFHDNLQQAGVSEKVRHLRKFSSEAMADVPDEIDLLYIDGAHRFRPALDDIRQWSARIAPGGTLLIHDSFSSIGVTGALVAELFFSREFRYLGRSESMTHYRREPLVGAQRRRNAARQAAQLPWFARNVAIKGLIVAHLGRLTRPVFGHDPSVWPY
jgi:predicted O-methyltransferase YrrM